MMKERPDHASKPRRFGPSKAKVQAAHGQAEDEVVAQIRTILGRPRATLPDAANLAGAPDDAVVTVAVIPMHGSRIIEIQAENVAVNLRILLYRRFDGKPILEDDQIDVSEELQRQGHGARLIGRQVEHAIRLGVAEILTYAVRNDEAGDVGYWVWPLLGFDGRLPREVIERLPADLSSAQRVSELMKFEPGQSWWRSNGDPINLVFDLGPNSLDLRHFRGYLRQKGLP
jgi:GNAT superfamily N-acetyltransferase